MPTIEANGETIFFVDEGDGPPILFIHSLGSNNSLYRDQIAALKSSYRCIAPDCRGHGASSYNGTFTVEDAAADHKAVAYLSMLEFGNQYAGDRLMPSTPIDKLDELAAEIAKCPPKAYVDTVRAIFTYDATGDLAKVTAPTLILIGDSDDATPMAESEFIRDGIKGSEIRVIPDAGHLSTIDSPDEFTAELSAFLSAQG